MSFRTQAFLLSLVILTVASTILYLDGEARYSEFDQGQRRVMDTLLKTVSHEAGIITSSMRRRADVFAIEYQPQIGELARNPGDDAAREFLEEKIALHFPEHFAFTITDASGAVMLENIEGLVGDVCQQDIQKFSSGQHTGGGKRINQLRIHPQPFNYHFDIMSHWGTADNQGTFFVSFRPDQLVDLLSQREFPGFQLMLIKRDDNNLIEITAAGTRDQLQRDIHLTEQEAQRIEYSTALPGTWWTLVVLARENLFSDYRRTIRWQSLFVFLVLLVTTGLMMTMVNRQENHCNETEKALRDAQGNNMREIDERESIIKRLTSDLEEETTRREAAEGNTSGDDRA